MTSEWTEAPAPGRPVPRVVLAAVLMGCVLLPACGLTSEQKAAIEKFSKATVGVADLAADSMVATREDVIRVRTEMRKLSPDLVDPEDPANDLDGPLDLVEIDRRLRALQALHEFAELLGMLAVDEQTGRLKAATDSMLASLEGIEGVSLSPEKADAIQALVLKISGLWVERKRKCAIQAVLGDTREAISTILELLAKDYDPDGYYWLGALTQMEPSVQSTLPAVLSAHEAGVTPRDPTDDPEDPETVKMTDADIALLWSQYEALKVDFEKRVAAAREISKRMKDVLSAMEEAHTALLREIEAADDLSSVQLDGFYGEVKDTLRVARVLIGS